MGKRDDIKGRSTREFDSSRLAALTKDPGGVAESGAEPSAVQVQQIDAPPDLALGRTVTLDDPMTTGLLAEVARRSQTADFDEELIKEVLSKMDAGQQTPHPHTRRRSR